MKLWLVLILALFAVATPAAAQAPAEADVPDSAAVEIDGETLFRVRGVGPRPAAERAADMAEVIVGAARDPNFRPETIQVFDRGHYHYIASGSRALARVTDPDAELEDVDRRLLAPFYADRIKRAIVEYRESRSRAALGRSAVRSLLAIGVAAVLLGLFIWLLRRFGRALQGRFERRTGALTEESRRILRVDQLWQSLRGLLYLIRATAVLVTLFFLIQYVLLQFPQTRGAGRRLLSSISDPLGDLGGGFVAAIPNLVVLAILFLVARYILTLSRLFFEGIATGSISYEGFEKEWAKPTSGLVRIAIIGAALVVAFPFIPGSSSDAFRGLSVLAGVLVAIGSGSAMANIVAGYLILYRRAFNVGDRVKIGDSIGTVVDMRMQMTELRNFRNEAINIPNALILSSEVTNYTKPAREGRLILHSEVGIGYEVPWRQVEVMLVAAARATDGLLPDPPPFVLQSRLGDFAVFYQVHAYTERSHDIPRIEAELNRNILDQFNAQGVQIMTPAYESDPEQPKIVAPENWHVAPAGDSQGKDAPHPVSGPSVER